MPEGMSDERKKLMRSYGADLIFTAGGESDVDLSLDRLEEVRREDPDRYWVPAQFSNQDNVAAHYETTGPEIWEQCGGRIGAFVAAQGSGGTLTGVGRYLREHASNVALYAVEPAECPILAHRRWGPHGIEGIGDGFVPDNLDVSLLTGAAAVKLARTHPELSPIVVMANDTGQRYFSTALCNEEKHVAVPERDHGLDDRSRELLDRYQAGWEVIERA
jgi:cysteine synthase A